MTTITIELEENGDEVELRIHQFKVRASTSLEYHLLNDLTKHIQAFNSTESVMRFKHSEGNN